MIGKLFVTFPVLMIVLFYSSNVGSREDSKVLKNDRNRVAKVYSIDKKTGRSTVEKGSIDEKGLVHFRCKPILEWLKNAGIELIIKTQNSQIFRPGKIVFCNLKKDKALFSLEPFSSDEESPLESTEHTTFREKEEAEQVETNFVTELDYSSLFQRALQYRKLKRYDKALFYYSRTLSLNPDSIDANLSLGNVYFILGRYEEAIRLYKKALEYSQGSKSSILIKIGTSHLFLNDYDKAIEVFKEIQAIEPTASDSYFALGLIYYINDRHEEAFNEYLKLNEVAPAIAENLFDILYR